MLWLLCKLEAGVSDEIGIESVQRIRGVYEEEGFSRWAEGKKVHESNVR